MKIPFTALFGWRYPIRIAENSDRVGGVTVVENSMIGRGPKEISIYITKTPSRFSKYLNSIQGVVIGKRRY